MKVDRVYEYDTKKGVTELITGPGLISPVNMQDLIQIPPVLKDHISMAPLSLLNYIQSVCIQCTKLCNCIKE